MVSELDILMVTLSLFVELSRSSGTVFTLNVNVAVPPSSDVGPLIGVMVNPGVSSSTFTTKISSRSIDLVMSILMIFFAGLLSVQMI